MDSGRQQIKYKVKRQRTRKDWSESKRLSDGTLLMYGRRGACYFLLHSEGIGRGFAELDQLIKAVESFEFTRLGEF